MGATGRDGAVREPEDGTRRRRRALRAAAHVAAATALACGGGESPAVPDGGAAGGAGPVSTGEGAEAARRIRDPRPAWRRPARLELIRQTTGGRGLAAGGGDVQRPVLGDVRDVTGTSDGRLLVLDGSGARVVVFDRSGSVDRVVGRRGPGPGELRSPDRVEPAPGGGVLVFERRPAAVHRWRPDGSYAGARGIGTRRPAEGTDDAASGGKRGVGIADWGPSLPGGRAVRVVRLDPEDPSSGRSAVYVADTTGLLGRPVATWTTAGTSSRLPEAFGARWSWTAGPAPDGAGRIAVAPGDRYEITVYDAGGRPRTVIARDVRAESVTSSLRERAVERFVEEAVRAGAPPSLVRRLRERLPVAETLPVIAGLWHSGPDGRLWVGIPGAGGPGEPLLVSRAYDVYEGDGSLAGRVAAPPGFRLHRVRGSLLYGSWRDSLDVPRARVYRLVEPGGPSAGR